MKFFEITMVRGGKRMVNFDRVDRVEPAIDGGALILMSGYPALEVKETYAKLYQVLMAGVMA